MSNDNEQTNATKNPAVVGPVERWVRRRLRRAARSIALTTLRCG